MKSREPTRRSGWTRRRAVRFVVYAWITVGVACIPAYRTLAEPQGRVRLASPASAGAPLPASTVSIAISSPPASSGRAVSAVSASGASAVLPSRHPPLSPAEAASATTRALDMRRMFSQEVTRKLTVPVVEQRAYVLQLQRALAAANLADLAGEYVVMVDRAATIQALFIYFRATPANAWFLIGASPVATGLPGTFDHFLTPLGVFDHTPDNMDFRAEGTTNENGIRGYGRRDMRIYDFGWIDSERGWGKGGTSPMRFQMHATDPDRLEPLLGVRHSKGCVRIPASLNVFIDRHGILDANYEAQVEAGRSLWVLHPGRDVTPIEGRYLVVVDSMRKTRPAWAHVPGRTAWAKVPKEGDTAD